MTILTFLALLSCSNSKTCISFNTKGKTQEDYISLQENNTLLSTNEISNLTFDLNLEDLGYSELRRDRALDQDIYSDSEDEDEKDVYLMELAKNKDIFSINSDLIYNSAKVKDLEDQDKNGETFLHVVLSFPIINKELTREDDIHNLDSMVVNAILQRIIEKFENFDWKKKSNNGSTYLSLALENCTPCIIRAVLGKTDSLSEEEIAKYNEIRGKLTQGLIYNIEGKIKK